MLLLVIPCVATLAADPSPGGCGPGLYANERQAVVLYERPSESGRTDMRYRGADGRLGGLDAEESPLACSPAAGSSPPGLVPQLWVIAVEDTVAPGLVTRDRLATLQREGEAITTALFPDTDHGMVEFVVEPDGARTITRITEGYFRLVTDYMKGRLSPPYGRGFLVEPKAGRSR
jgi:hypothetical protein